MILSSPDPGPGVPLTLYNSVKDQGDVVKKVIRDWEFAPYILGLGLNTTSNITDWKRGSVKLIEKEIGEAI